MLVQSTTREKKVDGDITESHEAMEQFNSKDLECSDDLQIGMHLPSAADAKPRQNKLFEALGTLNLFVDMDLWSNSDELMELVPDGSLPDQSESSDVISASSAKLGFQLRPPYIQPRRPVERRGDQISRVRVTGASGQSLSSALKHLKLRAPSDISACSTAASREFSPHRRNSEETFDIYSETSARALQPAEQFATPELLILPPALESARQAIPRAIPRTGRKEVLQVLQAQRSVFSTNFTSALVSSSGTMPRREDHPLLTAMQKGNTAEDSAATRSALPTATDAERSELSTLRSKLCELRWREHRRGPWAVAPVRGAAEQHGTEGRSFAKERQEEQKETKHKEQEEVQQLIRLMDRDKTGCVAPDLFVPLMFWMGLARNSRAVDALLSVAFGPLPIDCETLSRTIVQYSEVQLQLVNGLRNRCWRDSPEQLAELLTEKDNHTMKTWFSSMRRDQRGMVDPLQVQQLLTRLEVPMDRQTLFRFLHFFLSGVEVEKTTSKRGPGASERKFSYESFASLICRSVVAVTLHRTTALLSVSDSDRELAYRWTQLQRKILISILINQRFWGSEARAVLARFQPAGLANDISPEQVSLLYQRVRAQGLDSILPEVDGQSGPLVLPPIDAGRSEAPGENGSWPQSVGFNRLVTG